MRKYLLIGFLILAFGITGFAQNQPKFKIEDFVRVKASTDRTAIYVGDRFKLTLEIVYPKDWGIEILIEDLEKSSTAAVLPDSIVLEKAEISKPMPWNKYWLKIKVVYSLFYPEKKHNIGILFFSEEPKPFTVRFKWVNEKIDNPEQGLEVHGVRVNQFVLGVRSTLTDTSREPRDSKMFSGNFHLKAVIGYIVGFILILFSLSVPVRAAIQYFQHEQRGNKELPIREFLKKELQKLNSQISDNDFRRTLRSIIGKKAGFNALALTSAEIKEKAVGKDSELITLALILEKYDELGYNTEAESISKSESIETTKKVISEWIPDKWYQKLFKRIKKW